MAFFTTFLDSLAAPPWQRTSTIGSAVAKRAARRRIHERNPNNRATGCLALPERVGSRQVSHFRPPLPQERPSAGGL